MRKVLVLTTLLFALLLAGCTEDNNNGSQAGNGGGDTGFNTTPGLSIKASYSKTTVTFNADLYGTTLGESYNFKWDFGDSKTDTTANPTHEYSREGQYTVTVSITDKDGNEVGSAILMVNINLSGTIVDDTLRVVGEEDPLTFTFETKARSDDGAPLVYTWIFEEGMAQEVGGNIMTHTFSKYGKTYNPKLRVDHKISGANFEKSIKVTTKKPNFTISCSGSVLTATCRPVIAGMPEGFEDAVYTWNFGGVQRTTTGNNAATYTFTEPGTKEISVIGTSSKVEGNFQADTQVSFSNQISLGAIECAETGANLLEYRCTVPVTLAEGASQNLTYTWDFNGQRPTTVEGNSATYAFAKFPPTNNPSYPVSVTVGFSDQTSKETASTNRRIEIAHPTVSIARGSSTSSTGASFDAILSRQINGATYSWTITGPNNFNLPIEGVDKTNTGNIELQYEGTYTANLTVSHGSFASNITAQPLEATISAAVEDASFSCTKVNGMTYSCTTNARGYATVNGQRQEVPLEYTWRVARGDGNENYGPDNDPKFTQRAFSQTFQKYDGTYNVSLTVKPQNTNKIVAIPPQTFKTDHMSVSINKPATIGQNEQGTLTAVLSGEVANIQADSVTYKWYIDGTLQSSTNQSINYTFTQAKVYRIKVEANASNFGSVLSYETTIEVIPTTVLPKHISDVTLSCKNIDELNDIRKLCTANIQLTTAGNNDRVQVKDLEARVIAINPRNGSGYDPVVFNSGQEKYVIFDWPWINVADIENISTQKNTQC